MVHDLSLFSPIVRICLFYAAEPFIFKAFAIFSSFVLLLFFLFRVVDFVIFPPCFSIRGAGWCLFFLPAGCDLFADPFPFCQEAFF